MIIGDFLRMRNGRIWDSFESLYRMLIVYDLNSVGINDYQIAKSFYDDIILYKFKNFRLLSYEEYFSKMICEAESEMLLRIERDDIGSNSKQCYFINNSNFKNEDGTPAEKYNSIRRACGEVYRLRERANILVSLSARGRFKEFPSELNPKN
jgi:hypothetical protein